MPWGNVVTCRHCELGPPIDKSQTDKERSCQWEHSGQSVPCLVIMSGGSAVFQEKDADTSHKLVNVIS